MEVCYTGILCVHEHCQEFSGGQYKLKHLHNKYIYVDCIRVNKNIQFIASVAVPYITDLQQVKL